MVFRDVTLDYFQNPSLGIPLLGHALGLGPFAAGFATSQLPFLTSEGSEALDIARQEGVKRAWEKREDIPWWVKLGTDVGLALTLNPLTAQFGPMKGLPTRIRKPLAPGFGRLIGSFAPEAQTYAEKAFAQPLHSTIRDIYRAAPQLETLPYLKKIPFIEKLSWPFKSNAISTEFVYDIQDQLKRLDVSPKELYSYIYLVREGAMPLEKMRKEVPLPTHTQQRVEKDIFALSERKTEDGTSPLKKITDIYNKETIELGEEGARANFYTSLSDLLARQQMKETGIERAYVPPRFRAYQNAIREVNNFGKEILRSNPGMPVGNLVDGLTKMAIAGVPVQPILRDLKNINWKKFWETIKSNPKDMLDPATGKPLTIEQQFQRAIDELELPALQSEEMQRYLGESIYPTRLRGQIGVPLGEQSRKSYFKRTPDEILAALGAGGGLVTGGPVGAPLSAALLLGTKYGAKFSDVSMQIIETMLRKHSFLEGAKRYFSGKELEEFFKPEFRGNLAQLPENIKNEIVRRGYLLSPEKVREISVMQGMNPAEQDNILKLWKDLHEESVRAGTEYALKYNFPYHRDTNLISLLRYLTPFPVWPARNLPFYGEQAAKYPAIPAAIASLAALSSSENNPEEPRRLEGKLPMFGLGGGQVYANPLAGLSITSQINPLFQPAPGANVTGIDVAQDLASTYGLGLSPWWRVGLQAGGLLDQKQDIQSFFPMSRPIQGLAQLVGITNPNPDLMKAPLELARGTISPSSSPTTSYQDYLVRKKLGEMALEQTGRPWYENIEFVKSMIDKDAPLYQEANRSVGREQLALWGVRRALPAEIGYISEEEQAIRGAKAGLGDFLSSSSLKRAMQEHPEAFGYRWLNQSGELLGLRAMLNYYNALPNAGKEIFLLENPGFQQFITWREGEKKAGREGKIEQYIQYQQNPTTSRQ